MRKNIIIIRKVVVAIAVLFIFVFLSENLHELTKNRLINICKYIIPIALFLLFLTELSEKIVDFCQGLLAKKERELWKSIKKSMQVNIIHYIEQQGKMPISVIYQLMIIYHRNDKICTGLTKILINKYYFDDKSKNIISFILLNNQNNNIISAAFNNIPELKKQCEVLSKDNVDFALKYDIKNNGITDRFIVGLLHVCLPSSNLNKEQTIYLLRCLLGWILEKQSSIVTDEEKNTLMSVVTILPLIKQRLQNADFYDEYIIDTLEKIEQAKWLKESIDKSFNCIFNQLDRNLDYCQYISDNIKHICIIRLYYDKLTLCQREKMYKKIKSIKKKLTFIESDEKMLTFLLYASQMKNSNKNDELIYELATIVCLCAGQFV